MIMKVILKVVLSFVLVVALVCAYYLIRRPSLVGRGSMLMEWLRQPSAHPDWMVKAGQRCADAPFLFPTDGYVGFIWDDSFRPGHRHQGIDIFGGGQPGQTPVFAVYDGFLTRLPEWKSSVIIRIPDDPLHPGRQIWTYYTHMADAEGVSFISPDFPPGTQEVFVKAGTFLGFQGNYSGNSLRPVGVHLHFSIVQDDPQGGFLNELDIRNTLDPSSYFKMKLNAHENISDIPVCLPLYGESET